MQTLTIRIQPLSAFAGNIRGDTLFGQLCWALQQREGNAALAELLDGYTSGKPFMIVSDAFPAGKLPLPALPLGYYSLSQQADRKQLKRLRWINREDVQRPVHEWLQAALSAHDPQAKAQWEEQAVTHNTINRLTGTTGTGMFAPYTLSNHWPADGQELDIYISFDETRIQAGLVETLLADTGMQGYGRDASVGLGKFSVQASDNTPWPGHASANAWLTLAPLAPQGLAWKAEHCHYRPFTRFGRHGGAAVHTGQPFKTPVLLADTAALLVPQDDTAGTFAGQGLGGDGSLSRAIEATVQQGYAPVLAVRMEEQA